MSSHSNTNPPLASYDAAQEYLAGRIDYERMQSMPCGEEAFKLDRMREMLRLLGNPQQSVPIVHIAGTKGKGSTAAMIASILSAAGRRTGLFTSPHLERVEERMIVDGNICEAEEFAELVRLVRPVVETMDRAAAERNPPELGPTYFEILTAMALLHFTRQKVDAAILEVGMGGRLDSTNVCQPLVSIITSISFDHTKQLGDTLAAIAAEKAGIIKPGVPVVSGIVEEEPRRVIREIAQRQGSRLVELGVDFDFDYRPASHAEQAATPGHVDFRYGPEGLLKKGTGSEPTDANAAETGGREAPVPLFRHAAGNAVQHCNDIALGLLGHHQAANAAVAMTACEELRRVGWDIPETAVRAGLARVTWPARIEVVSRRPTVILDAAHNAASIAALVKVLEESFCARRRFLIFATTREKDLRGMLECLLGRFDDVIFTRYRDNPRSMPPEKLQTLALELSGTRYPICGKPGDAWDAIRRLAQPADLICITGSFFIAAEMRRELELQPISHDVENAAEST